MWTNDIMSKRGFHDLTELDSCCANVSRERCAPSMSRVFKKHLFPNKCHLCGRASPRRALVRRGSFGGVKPPPTPSPIPVSFRVRWGLGGSNAWQTR